MVTWKTGILLPRVTHQHGIEELRGVGEVGGEQYLLGELNETVAERLVFNDERVRLRDESAVVFGSVVVGAVVVVVWRIKTP